jgi:uncharacterized protein with FMN-binding domain
VRTRVVVGSAVASAAVLITGWVIGSAGSGTGSSSGTAATSSVTLTDGKYTGTTVETRYGPVQVEITVSGGTITDVTALQLTNAEQRSVEISNQAAPLLRSEVLAAQSASVATISGATYTTDGYLSSLQSAIDKAKA